MSRDHFNLDGKVAVIGGGSRGIGQSIANILAEYGAQVIVSSRRYDGCKAVADAIAASGGKAEAVPCHLGELSQIDALFGHVEQKYGRVDILVNNAAANPYYGHVLDIPVDAFEKTLDVNIRGYFYMSVAAAKLMRKGGGGSIINVASVAGVTPGAKQAVYSMTKAAILNMTRGFANECAEFNIRVNALLPGLTRTRFAQALHDDEDFHAEAMVRTSMKRSADPDEMAGAVLYLASNASSYTTGSSITVDGGYLA